MAQIRFRTKALDDRKSSGDLEHDSQTRVPVSAAITLSWLKPRRLSRTRTGDASLQQLSLSQW